MRIAPSDPMDGVMRMRRDLWMITWIGQYEEHTNVDFEHSDSAI